MTSPFACMLVCTLAHKHKHTRAHIHTHTRTPPQCTRSHSARIQTFTCVPPRVHVRALSVLTCTHMYTLVHRHTHMCTAHPSTPLGLQMSRKSCFWDVSFQGCGQFFPPGWVPEMSRLPPYPGFPFFGSFVVHSGLQTFFPSKAPHLCCWTWGWAEPGADIDLSAHPSVCLPSPLWPMCAPPPIWT